HDVTRRVLAERDLRQRTADLELMRALNSAFDRGEDLDALLSLARQRLQREFGFAALTFYLLDEARGRARVHLAALNEAARDLVARFLQHALPELWLQLERAPLHRRLMEAAADEAVVGEEIAALAAEYRAAAALPPAVLTALDEFLDAYLSRLGLAEVRFFPLQARGERLGALAVGVREALQPYQIERLRRLSEHLAGVVQRARRLQQATRLAHRLEKLGQAAQQIVRLVHDPEQVYQTVHQVVASLMPAEAFVIALADYEKKEIYSVYLVDRGGRAPNIRMPLNKGLSGEVIRRGEAIVEADYPHHEDPYDATHFGSPDAIRSLVAVPIRHHDKVIGMMSAQSYQPHAYTPEDALPLEILAGYTAIALENVGLLTSLNEQMELLQVAERHLERNLRQAQALYRVAQWGVEAGDEDEFLRRVTELLAERFYSEHCGVLLVDELGEGLRVHPAYKGLPEKYYHPDYRMPLGAGVAGKVLRSGRPFRSGDVRTEPAFIETTPGVLSEMCVPLRAGDRVLGVLNVESTQPDAYSEADERFLVTLAGTVASALRNLRLFAAESRRSARLEALLSLSSELDLLPSISQVGQRLVNGVREISGCASCSFFVPSPQDGAPMLIAQAGLPEDLVGRVFRDPGGRLRRALLRGELVIFSTREEIPPSLVDQMGRRDVAAFFLYPLLVEGRLRGAFSMSFTRPHRPSPAEIAAFRLLADRVAARLENLRLLNETRRHVGELERLREVGLEISAARALQDILPRIVAAARDLVDADDTHIFLLRDSELRFGAAAGREGVLPDPHTQPREDGLTATVARTGERLVIPDVRHHPLYRDYEPEFRGAIAGFPLISGERVVGVLNVAFEQPHEFDEHEIHLLELLAAQAAVALEQADLLENNIRRAREMGAMAEALQALLGTLNLDELLQRILDAALRAIPAAEKGSLSLRVTDDQMEFRALSGYPMEMLGRRFPVTWGFVGRVLKQKRGLMVEDVNADPQLRRDGENTDLVEARQVLSAVCVPLFDRQGEIIGAMSLDNLHRANAFDQNDLALLTSFARQASVAIENSRLYTETRRRLREMEAVHRLSTALRQAQTEAEMASLLLDEVGQALDLSAGAVLFLEPQSRDLVPIVERGWFARLPRRLPYGSGLAGRALLTQELQVSRDLHADRQVYAPARPLIPQGWGGVAVPILATGERIGVLEVGVPPQRSLSDEALRLLRTLAEIAGNAIYRARLYAQTERRLQHLQALREVDHAIAASLEIGLPLVTLLNQLATHIGVPASAVLAVDGTLRQLYLEAQHNLPEDFDPLDPRRCALLLDEVIVSQRTLKIERREQIPAFYPGAEGYLLPPGCRAYQAYPLVAKGETHGVLELYLTDETPLDEDAQAFVAATADQAALAIDNARLFQGLQRANIELERAYDSTLEGWARMLELRDRETEGHSQRVVEMTLRLARRLGVPDEEMVHIRRGALLHDIGKIGIPDSILNKAGPLSEEEWRIMRQHPLYAYEMLKSVLFLHPALDIPYAHHERWDGSGYPRGLKGEQIPLAARIFAVVDVFDALTHERPYRPAWTVAQTLEYLRQEAGKTLDPQVVEAFLTIVSEEGVM
ncbi:MAG: GAF domain-containing protein, partial [Anaerolineae bacterium]